MIARRALLVLLVAAWSGLAAAHPTGAPPARELVRLQGHRSDTKAGDKTGPTMTVAALGVDHPFATTDVRTFGFGDAARDVAPVGARVVLQGSRDLLSRFTTARPDQLVTILAERRAGATDLFVLTVDLCPAR
jgi:hypothetical protein